MADAKIITYGELISATTDVVPDNVPVALSIEGSDGREYARVISTDSGERVVLGEGTGTAGEGIPVVIGPGDAGANEFTVGNGSGQEIEFDIGGTNIIKSQAATNFQIGTHAAHTLELITANTARLHIDATGTIVAKSGGIQYHQGTGVDTATTQAAYLANTAGNANDTLIIDFANGNVGDVTLTRVVDKVRFYNVPADGTAATVTARITQGGSNYTISYADADVACYSGVDSGGVTGEIKFSGGVHHTQSTGSGEVDIISFTSIPTGSTFNIYAAVIGQDFS